MKDYWKIIKSQKISNGVIQKGYLNTYPLTDFNNLSGAHRMFLKYALAANSILDFGAGDLKFKQLVVNNGYKGIFETLDTDNLNKYDYSDIFQVKEKFDLILCFEVIEHIQLDEFLKLLESFKKTLNKNGKLIITTPNIHHINHFWKTDVTHIRPYPYENLYSILKINGFKNIKLHRLAWRKCGWAKFYIKRILSYFLEVDYATNIAMIAEFDGSYVLNRETC